MWRGRFPAKKIEVEGITFPPKRQATRYGALKLAEAVHTIKIKEVVT